MGTETESQFQRLLQRAVEAAGQKQDAAKAIGVTPSRFSKLFHQAPGSYTLNVRNCFRLAALLGESPQVVLRAVGKGEIADALDAYAPRPRDVRAAPPDPLEEGLVEVLHHLKRPRSEQEAFVNSLRLAVGLPELERARGRRRA